MKTIIVTVEVPDQEVVLIKLPIDEDHLPLTAEGFRLVLAVAAGSVEWEHVHTPPKGER